MEVGDVVLVKDKSMVRNQWPVALISQVYPSSDSRIRKVEVVMYKDGRRSNYVRPVVDLVLLVKAKNWSLN